MDEIKQELEHRRAKRRKHKNFSWFNWLIKLVLLIAIILIGNSWANSKGTSLIKILTSEQNFNTEVLEDKTK